MKILLFGGSGQLGYEIQVRARDLNFEVVSPITSEVNISEQAQVRFLAQQTKPDVIVNCAAYTAVDKAEQEQALCAKINVQGSINIAEAAKEVGARVLHLSTDYVFDGSLGRPLREDDQTNPINVYGRTKLEGEQAILQIHGDRSLVVRTSSLYGQRGANFVRTMLDLFRSKELVRVVSDQVSSPTWAGWLSEVVLDLVRMKEAGIVHAACSGETSWFDFAATILELSRPRLEVSEKFVLEPIKASEFERPAPRPPFSVLDSSKLSALIGREPIHWKDALAAHLFEIGMLE